MQDCLKARDALGAQVLAVVDLQDGALLDYAEQHQDAERGHGVQLLAEQAERQDREGQGEQVVGAGAVRVCWR